MTLKKFVLIPVIIGVLACLIQALDQLLYSSVPPEGNVGFSWISFQSWAVYFLAGCTVRGGIKAFIAYAIGIAASIVIMVLGGALTSGFRLLRRPWQWAWLLSVRSSVSVMSGFLWCQPCSSEPERFSPL